MRRRSSAAAPLAALILLTLGCAGSPTAPAAPRCTTTSVFARESFYLERAESERDFQGTLEHRDVPSTPSGRDHRYFLGGVPVYSGGTTTEPAFRSAIGTTVVIRGKLVSFTHGQEIWTASMTVCR